jgi:DNA-binding HxlR family transcriptional regulator
MLTRDELPACPVATTVRLIGNKWKLLILRNLFVRPNRFGELLNTIPGISQKVLTENLRAMEQDGILIRTTYPEVPPRVEYKLSELGESMRPIIAAMESWGRSYQEIVRSTPDPLTEIEARNIAQNNVKQSRVSSTEMRRTMQEQGVSQVV